MKKWATFFILSFSLHALLLGLPLTFPEGMTPEPVPIVLDLEAGGPPKGMPRPEVPEKNAAPTAASPSHPKETQAFRKPKQDNLSKAAALSPGEVSPPTLPGEAVLNNAGDAPKGPLPSPRGVEPGDLRPRMATTADVITRVQPVYPLASRRRGEQGETHLLVRLGPGGVILSVEVTASSGYPSLDASALAAVKKWGFSPHTPKELIVPVIFRLE